jgi:small-conductance mechanosensitive channel
MGMKIGGALLLVLVVALVYKLLERGTDKLRDHGRLSHDIAFVLQRLLRWAAVIIGAVLVLGWLGFLENAWATVTAVLALVAIGFVATWSILSNVLCSIVLLLMRPFSVGDRIELPGQDLGGRVVNFTLVFTILSDDDGHLIQIPNNLFFQQPIRRRPGSETVELSEQIDAS